MLDHAAHGGRLQTVLRQELLGLEDPICCQLHLLTLLRRLLVLLRARALF